MKGIYSVNDPGAVITAREIRAAGCIAEQTVMREQDRLSLPESDPLHLSNRGLFHIMATEIWRWARMYERSGGTLELPQTVRKQLVK